MPVDSVIFNCLPMTRSSLFLRRRSSCEVLNSGVNGHDEVSLCLGKTSKSFLVFFWKCSHAVFDHRILEEIGFRQWWKITCQNFYLSNKKIWIMSTLRPCSISWNWRANDLFCFGNLLNAIWWTRSIKRILAEDIMNEWTPTMGNISTSGLSSFEHSYQNSLICQHDRRHPRMSHHY